MNNNKVLTMMTSNKLLMLKAENATLLHAMQLYLGAEALTELNKLLYKFAGRCVATHPNPKFALMVQGVKSRFERGDS